VEVKKRVDSQVKVVREAEAKCRAWKFKRCGRNRCGDSKLRAGEKGI